MADAVDEEGWRRVIWTEAGQIAGVLDWPDDGRGGATPQAYFGGLRASARLHDAVQFLAQALPRYEAVAWATRAVRDRVELQSLPALDAAALKAALSWVREPSEERRRAAGEAGMANRSSGPERLAALAAFYSGGSIAPADCPVLPAPKDAAGRLAAGAVLLAAARSADIRAEMNAALDAGEAIARGAAQDRP